MLLRKSVDTFVQKTMSDEIRSIFRHQTMPNAQWVWSTYSNDSIFRFFCFFFDFYIFMIHEVVSICIDQANEERKINCIQWYWGSSRGAKDWNPQFPLTMGIGSKKKKCAILLCNFSFLLVVTIVDLFDVVRIIMIFSFLFCSIVQKPTIGNGIYIYIFMTKEMWTIFNRVHRKNCVRARL